MNPNQPTPEQQAAMEAELNTEHQIPLKKREMIVIFNILVSSSMKYGDFVQIEPIIKKFEPIVAATSNIPPTNHVIKDAPLTGVKPPEENNVSN